MSTAAKYNVAFVGCGHRGKAHAAGVRADSRCNVVAVVDVNEKAAQSLATEYGFAKAQAYCDHLTMLARHKPDIAIISLWTPQHLPVFRDCALAGAKAVFCEKPMAPTWADCLEMAALAERTGCRLMFSHQRRFASGNRCVRGLLDEGVFGTVERMDLYSPPNLLDCGTHVIDQAMSFNQQIPGKWALGGVDCSEVINWFNVRAECMASGLVVFQNGVRASLQIGGPDMDLPHGVRVSASEGFIELTWDGQIKRAVMYRKPDWQAAAPPQTSAEEMMVAMVRHGIDCLESGLESEISWQRAIQAAEIIFALYESARRRARVNLPLTGGTGNPLHSILDHGA